MKKLIALFAVFLMILTACTKESDGTNSIEQITESGYNLQMVTHAKGVFDISTTPAGAYFNMRANRIGYFDDATGSVIPLCNRPECVHNDQSCTAYVDAQMFAVFTNPNKTKLFVSYFSDTEKTDTYPVQYIYSMDLNGENKKQIFRLATGDQILENYVFDGDDLYFIIQKKDYNTRTTNFVINRLNCQTGDIAEIYTLDEVHFIVGACDKYLILDNQFSSSDGLYSLFKFDIETHSMESIFKTEFTSEDTNSSAYMNGEYMYTFMPNGEKTAQLSKTNILTGQTSVLSENVTYYGTHKRDYLSPFFAKDKMFIESSLPPLDDSIIRRAQLVCIDLNSGETKNINIKDPYGNPVAFKGETENYYIYINSFVYVDMSVYNEDGTEEIWTIGDPDYRVIKKEDCLNSNNISFSITVN